MDFVKLASFNNKLEAETTAHLLDGEDIPYNIHSNEAIYGEGGVGPYVFLSVPAELREKALGIIGNAGNPAADA